MVCIYHDRSENTQKTVSCEDERTVRNSEPKMVPVEEERDLFEYDSIEELLERAKGKYTSGMNKEGIVIRPLEPVYSRIVEGPLSMKVLNNDYLLKK